MTTITDPYFYNEQAVICTVEYDELNRVIQKTSPGEGGIPRLTQYEFKADGNGHEIWVTNPENQTTIKRYNAIGNVVETEDNAGNKVKYCYTADGLVKDMYVMDIQENTTIHKEYDKYGNCILNQDPAKGTKEYEYNAFGELLQMKHNNVVELSLTSQDYDLNGRLVHKNEPGVGETWFTYDNQMNGVIDQKIFTNTSGDNFKTSYFYDEYGRITKTTEELNGTNVNEILSTKYSYNAYGQVMDMTYPSGFTIRNIYNQNGYLEKVVRRSNSQVIWQATQINARQQIEKVWLGNGVQTHKEYDINTGFLESIYTFHPSFLNQSPVQDFEYTWDNIGNLLTRKKNCYSAPSMTENFYYEDGLNRLTGIILNNGQETIEMDMQYDYLGRIQYKKSLNPAFHIADTYSYGDAVNPYILTSIDNQPTGIGSDDRIITYTPFDKICQIDEGNKQLKIRYGSDHSRKIQEYFENGVLVKKKLYLGMYEKISKEDGEISKVHYISAGDGIFAIYTLNSKSDDAFAYVHKDHLGSIQCLTDEEGYIIEEYSYDAWGNRRDPHTWYPVSTPGTYTVDRGYTGHEHIDAFNLVNMNGRVFDPVTSYFFSPDPLQEAPTFAQDFNPYVYCLNNPLSLVDPSGYSWLNDNWKSIVSAIVGITATVLTAGALGPMAAAFIGGFTSGFLNTTLNNGNIGQACLSGFYSGLFAVASASMAMSVHSVFKETSTHFFRELGRASMHAGIQGSLRLMQGGKFSHGFLAGFVGSAGGSFMSQNNIMKNSSTFTKVVSSAGLGGTAEALGGGKFANGAVTGAYVMLFNHFLHDGNKKEKEIKKLIPNGKINIRKSSDPLGDIVELFRRINLNKDFEYYRPKLEDLIIECMAGDFRGQYYFTDVSEQGSDVSIIITNFESTINKIVADTESHLDRPIFHHITLYGTYQGSIGGMGKPSLPILVRLKFNIGDADLVNNLMDIISPKPTPK